MALILLKLNYCNTIAPKQFLHSLRWSNDVYIHANVYAQKGNEINYTSTLGRIHILTHHSNFELRLIKSIHSFCFVFTFAWVRLKKIPGYNKMRANDSIQTSLKKHSKHKNEYEKRKERNEGRENIENNCTKQPML